MQTNDVLDPWAYRSGQCRVR